MKVGAFQIGRYHAIIKKSYADGSADYETSFSDEADLMESVYCIKLCVGKMVGLATDTRKSLPMCRLSGEKRTLSGNWRESSHEQDKTETAIFPGKRGRIPAVAGEGFPEREEPAGVYPFLCAGEADREYGRYQRTYPGAEADREQPQPDSKEV